VLRFALLNERGYPDLGFETEIPWSNRSITYSSFEKIFAFSLDGNVFLSEELEHHRNLFPQYTVQERDIRKS
jgi:hypothetical protein